MQLDWFHHITRKSGSSSTAIYLSFEFCFYFHFTSILIQLNFNAQSLEKMHSDVVDVNQDVNCELKISIHAHKNFGRSLISLEKKSGEQQCLWKG
jgi:hypothetical protein